MTQNYLAKNTDYFKYTTNFHPLCLSTNSKVKLHKTRFFSWFFVLSIFFVFLMGNKAIAQVTITKPNLSIPVCSGFPSSYYPLEDIEITETATSNFSSGSNITLILSAPANFEFKANTGFVSASSGADFTSISSLTVSSSVITLTYSVNSPTNKTDRLTFSQLQIRAINNVSTGNITRNGGTGTISGLITGTTLTNTITSVIGTPPSISNAGSNQTLTSCATTTTVAGNVPTSGTGLWSVVSGTATITTPSSPTSGVTGLTVGTTATLRWTISNGACESLFSDVTITTVRGAGCLVYCTPSVSSGVQASNYIKDVNFIGNITNSNNSSTYSSSPLGYQDQTNLGTRASQAQGEGVNIFTNTTGGANYMKAWVDWNSNGIFDESTEIVYQCTNAFINTTFGFKIPETTIPGNYRIRIRINKSNSTADNTFSACGNIANYGETEDYLFTVVANCAAKITSIANGFNCGTGSVTLGAAGTADNTQYRWYDSQSGGTLVETTISTTWSTPSISASKTFYVTAFNGSCESLFRTPVVATIKPIPTLTFANANPEVCGENSIIDLQASGNNEQVYLIDENFESGMVNFTSNSIAFPTGEESKTKWQIQSSTYVPPYPTFPVWYPAISSGFGTNKFAITTSDVVAGGTTFGKVENALESVIVNTTGFLNLSLSFKMYFSSYNDANSASVEYVNVEVSTNGGDSWNPTPIVQYLGDVGIGTQFVTSPNFNVNAFIGITSLKIRIRYKAGWCDGVAVDDIKLFGDKPLSPSFQWTSALPPDAYTNAACTLPYTAGTPASIVYIKPTLAQLEQSTYSFTAKANLANGCSTSAIINVTNKSKVWQNLTIDWNNSSNWKPSGVPTAANCVIIPNTTIIPGNNYNAYAKNLTVKSTGNLELSSTSNLTVTDFVDVNTDGIFNIRDKANLIQINNTPNTGIVNIERVSQPMYNIDYTYWNSPLTLASNFTLGSLSPNSPLMFSWIPTVSAGTGGNWKNENNATIMDPRKGYIIRAPTTFSSSIKTPYTATFKGTPNNGTVTAPIIKGTLTGVVDVDAENDEWNLIGNPYPSAIDAGTFVDFNANLNVIDGTIYVWTHNTAPSQAEPDPFYGDYALNYTENDYASFNRTGGVSTRSSATTGGSPPSGFIASGQSFFVRAANTMAPGTLNATFNNSMRVGVEGKNGDFFKMNKNQKNEAIPKNVSDKERHRIWLNLTNNSGAFSQILVGYIEGATQSLDRSFDGESFGGNDVGFYSIIPEAQLTIQGRSLPFDENDQVKLGYYSEISAKLSVRIDHFDGLFDNQNILLEDKELGIIHDLKDTPYVFQTEIGDFDDRFILRYTDKTLSLQDPIYDNAVTVFFTRSNNTLNIKNSASDNTVLSASLYDIQGKLLSKWDVKEKEQSNIKIPIQDKASAVYIVKLKTEKGTISKKIIVK